MRIRWKLPLAFAVGTLVFAGVVALASALILRGVFLDRLEDEMSRQARQFAAALAEPSVLEMGSHSGSPGEQGRPPSYPALQRFTQSLGQAAGARFTLIDSRGWVLADSEADPATLENHSNRPEVKQALAGFEARERRYSATLRQKEVYVALPLPPSAAPWSQGVIRIAQPADRIDSMLSAAWRIPLIVWAALLLPMLAAAYLITRSITRPLEQIRQMTQRVAAGDLAHRASLHRNDELGDLADSLNRMAVQLEAREQELQTETQRSRQILSAMNEGVLLMDEQGCLLRANPAAERILGVSLKDAVGTPLVLAARAFPARALAEKAWQAGRPVTELLETPDDRALVAEAIPLGRQPGGAAGPRGTMEPGQTLFVIRDETARRHTERMRRDFVSNVSHELKTPLAGISLLSQTLAGIIREDPEQAAEFALRLNAEVERLGHLVNDLLTLSRLEEAALPPPDSLGVVDLARVAEETCEELRPLVAAKGHELTLELPESLLLRGDEPGLRTLTRNLLDNAIRYTEPGGHIALRLRQEETRTETGETERWAVLEVTDDGIGIPLAEQKRIFERFYRVDKARSRETGGTGLGLSIVRHVAERHGGRVEVKSTVGVGSTFTVWLPSSAPEPVHQSSAE